MSEFAYSSAEPTWANSYLWPVLLRELRRKVPPPCDVFELGCGNGATARFLGQHGYAVTAVDPSVSGITIAERFQSPSLRFAAGSTQDDLASRYGTFPVVISLEVIEHCASAREFMRSFVSLMKPRGIGVLSTPYHGYLKNIVVAASGRFDHHFDPLWEGGHVKFFSIRKLRTLFDEFGLSYEFHRAGRIPPLAKSVVAVIQRMD